MREEVARVLDLADGLRDIVLLTIAVVPPANAGMGATSLSEPGALALFGAAVLFTGVALRRRRTRSDGGALPGAGTVNPRRSASRSVRADRTESVG